MPWVSFYYVLLLPAHWAYSKHQELRHTALFTHFNGTGKFICESAIKSNNSSIV